MTMTTASVIKPFALTALVLCWLGVAGATETATEQKLTANEAKEHFGEFATVCGEVVSAHYALTTNGEPTFLNLDKPFPNQIFTVVIWGSDRSKFGKPEEEYNGKRICVSGKITAYAGLPEIIAKDPKQIKLQQRFFLSSFPPPCNRGFPFWILSAEELAATSDMSQLLFASACFR